MIEGPITKAFAQWVTTNRQAVEACLDGDKIRGITPIDATGIPAEAIDEVCVCMLAESLMNELADNRASDPDDYFDALKRAFVAGLRAGVIYERVRSKEKTQ